MKCVCTKPAESTFNSSRSRTDWNWFAWLSKSALTSCSDSASACSRADLTADSRGPLVCRELSLKERPQKLHASRLEFWLQNINPQLKQLRKSLWAVAWQLHLPGYWRGQQPKSAMPCYDRGPDKAARFNYHGHSWRGIGKPCAFNSLIRRIFFGPRLL